MTHFYADTETFLISDEAPYPEPIVLTFCSDEGPASGVSRNDPYFLDAFEALFYPGVTSVWANSKYDLICGETHYKSLRALIYRALVEGRIHDVQIIQRLGNLATHGRLDGEVVRSDDPEDEGTVAKRFLYSVGALMLDYFKIDRSESKGDGVRMSYEAVAHLRWEDIDPAFKRYSLQDAEDVRAIYKAQRERWGRIPTETLQYAADYALGHMTERGVALDVSEFYALRKRTLEAMYHGNFPLMLESGVLRAPLPARPYKNQWKRAASVVGSPPARNFIVEPADERELALLAAEGIRIAEYKHETINTKELRAEVERTCAALRIEVRKTETEQTATDAEFLLGLVDDSPLLTEYQARQKMSKILSTELPRMCYERDLERPASIVRPTFKIIVETSRTSSSASDLFPSFNCQNVDPRARRCYKARDGKLLASVDFGAQDLVSLAQRCYDTFGYSTLRDNLNAGKDPHGYLGSVLASHLGGRGVFDYAEFMDLKESESRADFNFWKHYRTFAKPTGLGYPGGLGAATFVKYAKGTFGVKTTEEEAREIKQIWLSAYPEMVDYFEYVNKVLCIGDGLYEYTSPLGMVRTRTTYCAACNGFGLQTPSAEATKIATWNLDRACYDPAAGNELLFGNCAPLMQIHDEIIVEIPNDDLRHERAYEVARIMRESMRIITPDVKVKAEPALMTHWDKGAEAVFDENGKLDIWRPE